MTNEIVSTALTQIRNAALAKHEFVAIPLTNVTQRILEILLEENLITSFSEARVDMNRYFVIELKYYGEERNSAITTLRTISKQGLRSYTKHKRIQKVLDGFGIAILSTSKGIMTDRMVRQEDVGGEVLCYVW